MRACILSLLMLLAGEAAAKDLAGRVVGPDNIPVAGATVLIYSTAPLADSPDCSKSAKTDASGAFKLADVDVALKFDVFIAAEGYRPVMQSATDPAKDVLVKLQPMPADLDSHCVIRGHVADSKGAAVVGAKVTQVGYTDSTNMHSFGPSRDVEKQTFTDTKGEFALISKTPDLRIDVELTAREAAPKKVLEIAPGEKPNEIQMLPGMALTGRLVRDQQPIAGAIVKLNVSPRKPEQFEGELKTTTNTEGRFIFKHAAPENYNIFVPIQTLPDGGAVATTTCGVPAEGETVDVGDIAVEKGLVVSGQLVCTDGKPVPAGAKIRLQRSSTFDIATATVDAEGKFEFTGIPAAEYELTMIHKQYHFSSENQSYIKMAGFCCLLGIVEQDARDLRISLDPGPLEAGGQPDWTRMDALKKRPLNGVAQTN